ESCAGFFFFLDPPLGQFWAFVHDPLLLRETLEITEVAISFILAKLKVEWLRLPKSAYVLDGMFSLIHRANLLAPFTGISQFCHSVWLVVAQPDSISPIVPAMGKKVAPHRTYFEFGGTRLVDRVRASSVSADQIVEWLAVATSRSVIHFDEF